MKAFECKMCGSCCHGEDGTTIQGDKIEALADFLGKKVESFLAEFCLEKYGRVFIKTGPEKLCILYNKEKGCLVHPVKPHNCALWPFFPALLRDKDNWETAKGACPGLNPNCSFEEFVRQSNR